MADVSPGGAPDQSASREAAPPSPPDSGPPATADPASPAGPEGGAFPRAASDPFLTEAPTVAHSPDGAPFSAGAAGAWPPASGAPSAEPPGDGRGAFAGAASGTGGLEAVTPPPSDVLPAVDGVAGSSQIMRVPGRAGGWRRWLPIVLVITVLFAGAIGMLVFLGFDIGIAGLTVGLIAAAVPVPLLVSSFLWLDRYEPEPIRYLAFCFTWGAAIATAAALVVNQSAAYLFDKIGLPDALVAVLVAPFIEESMKALGPILLVWRRRSEWSGITDGIVYCGMSAIGFAMVENVLYLGKHGYATGVEEYGPATGLQNLFLIFIVRILFTGFAHPLFTSMTGIGLGISSRSGDRRVRWLAPIAGLLLAMILHGTFNLLPTLSTVLSQPLIMLYGYLGFMVPLFFAVVGFAIALRGWEGRLTERVLPHYVRTGWFAPPEVAALGSLGRRHSARQWAKRVAGGPGQKAMRNFQFAATRLALLRDGMQRGLNTTPTELLRSTTEERELLVAIQSYRTSFTARDPQAPPAFWDGEAYHVMFPDGETRMLAAPAEPVVPIPIRLAYGAPGHGGTTYGAPGYGPPTPGYGPPGYGTPAYGSTSGYGASAYGAPTSGYGAPAYGAPTSGYGISGSPGQGYSTPGYGAPANGASGYGPPGYGTPAGGAPAYGASTGDSPGYGASPYDASAYGAPAGGAPGYGAPAAGGSQYGASTPHASPYGPPGSGAAGYGVPGGGSPYGGPASPYGPPESGAAGYGVPGGGSPYGAPASPYGPATGGVPGRGGAGYGGPASPYGPATGDGGAGYGEPASPYGPPGGGAAAQDAPADGGAASRDGGEAGGSPYGQQPG